MRLGIRLSALLLTAATACPLWAASNEPVKDWPQFHGPARDNISHETGLLKVWPDNGPPLVWNTKGLGRGFSSVTISNGKIFSSGDGPAETSFVVAFKESDGSPLWKAKLGKPGSDQPQGPGTLATPTVDGDLVYAVGQYGELICVKAADGIEVWRTHLGKDLGGKMPTWGFTESIVIEGDNVICTPGGKDGTVAALNKKTGKVVWRSKDFTDNAAYSAPVIVTIEGTKQGVVLTEKSIAGIAMTDGKLLWRHDRHGKTAVIPTPIVKDNFVYVTSGYGIGSDLFKVTVSDGHFNVEPVYTENKVMVDHHGGVILIGNEIYGHSDSGGWTCQDFMTGASKWVDGKVLGKGTLSYADGLFYMRGEGGAGTIVLAEMTPEKLTKISHFDPPFRTKAKAWAHLVIANGKLYVRDQDLLLCYDVKGK